MVEDPSCFPPAGVCGRRSVTEAADPPPLPDDWREATLVQLDAWVEERERLLEEFDRRIEQFRGGAAQPSPHAAARRSPEPLGFHRPEMAPQAIDKPRFAEGNGAPRPHNGSLPQASDCAAPDEGLRFHRSPTRRPELAPQLIEKAQ